MRIFPLLALALLCGCKKHEAAGTGSPAAAGSGSATAPAPIDAAPPPPVDAPPPDAAKADPGVGAAELQKTVCPKVIEKIEACAKEKEFAKALSEGADAKEQKKIKKLIGEIAEWPTEYCSNFAANYQFVGFLDHWDQLADPAILESCGKLGAAVKAAGGLFGGDQAL
jgi:hypothetical protein